VEVLKEKFKDVLKNISPIEIPFHPFEIDPNVPPEKLMNLPQSSKNAVGVRLKPDESRFIGKNDLKLNEGYLSVEELSAIFKAIPVDVTFINEEDISKSTFCLRKTCSNVSSPSKCPYS